MLTFTDRAREMVRTYMEQSDGELTALRISSGDATPGSPSWELALVADDEWAATDVEFETGELTVLVERDVADLLEGAVVDYVERGGQVGFQVDTRPGGGQGPSGSVPAATTAAPGAGSPSGDDLPEGSPAAQARDEKGKSGGGQGSGRPSPFGETSTPHAPPPTEDERIEIENPPEGPMADRIRELLEARINPAVAMHGGHIGLADVKGGEIFIVMSGGCQGCALSRMTLKQGVERMIRQEIPEVTAVHDVTDHAKGDNPYYEAPIG
ncbi:MAG: NifU family protein [Longimicrobiales bacterium]|nr:NifU family protein [Longimicrobiales bacterium]